LVRPLPGGQASDERCPLGSGRTKFDALPEVAKYEVALEILRRTRDVEFPPLTGDDLVANAEVVFLELD